MKRHTVALIFLICLTTCKTASSAGNASIKDIIDEAKAELADLRAIVLGNIQAAQDEFSHLYSDITSYGINMLNLGTVAIDQENDSIHAEINQLKDLANGAHKDISSCTEKQEVLIKQLATESKENLEACLQSQREEAERILDDSRYVVDVTMSKIDHLDYQLKVCGQSISCVKPILSLIEKYKLQLPQSIKLEINAADELLTQLKVIMRECENDRVADYSSEASAIYSDVVDCVDKILG